MSPTATTQNHQALRAVVERHLGVLQVPETTPAGEVPQRREDGVLEFYKHWRVRAAEVGQEPGEGLFATYSDQDDVIEVGLSQRDGSGLRNVVHVSLALDDDHGELNVVSEARSELNFDAVVTADKIAPLEDALRFFVAAVQGQEGD